MKSLTVREEIRRRGWSQTIRLAALTAGAMTQYGRDSEELRAGRRQCGAFNTVTIFNQSLTTIGFYPDFAQSRLLLVAPGTIITKDEITYQEFEIRNLGAVTADAAMITITYGFEPPFKRDRDDPMAGGRRF